MDATAYKHVGLGLIFHKCISDAFGEQRARLEVQRANGADPEAPDEYRAVNIFWVPKAGCWSNLKANAKRPNMGKVVDDAMLAIERNNLSLKGVLPKEYAHLDVDKKGLGQLIDLVGNIGLGDKVNRSRYNLNISVYGQESNYAIWWLAEMNLAIRGIDDPRKKHADSFYCGPHPDLKSDYVLANPPFNIGDRGGTVTASLEAEE